MKSSTVEPLDFKGKLTVVDGGVQAPNKQSEITGISSTTTNLVSYKLK